MTDSFARAGAWLLVQAAQVPDTVLMRQVGQDPGWFEKVSAVASGLMTIAILVLAVALVPAAWNFRKSYAKTSDLLDKVYGDINPLMRHASAIAVVFSNQLCSCPTCRIRTVSGTCVACTSSHAPARANESVIATLG